jgi:hypothetical protein
MKEILRGLIDSFKSNEAGFSARKLSGFAAIVIAAHATFKYCNATVLDAVLTTWLMFAAVCLGLVTLQQIINFKTGKGEEPKP